jgi:predicted membrane protein
LVPIKINIIKSFIIKRTIGLMLFSLLFSLSACLGIQTHVKGIEPSAHPLTTGKYEIIEPVEFQVSRFKLFWFFPVTPDLKIYETIDETVNNKGGDNLIDMQIWHERQFWILGTVDIVHIKGKIIRTAD